MAQPLIYGAVGPKGGDYLLEFSYDYGAYTMRNPFSVLGGTASEALSEGLLDVASYITSEYPVGRATYFLGQDGKEISPFFANGVEIELHYAGNNSGLYEVWVSVRPNGDFHRTLYLMQHSAGQGEELVVRIVCKPEILQIYVGDSLVHERDPQTIDWSWVGPQPHYWMHLEVGTPFERYSDFDGLVSIDGDRRFFQGSRVPHIREISYSLPRSQAPAFFQDFVRAYEIAGEGSGVAPTDPTDPTEPSEPPEDFGDDTVLVLDAPSMSPISVESLPFRVIFDYGLGDRSVPPPLFVMDLAAGTYKFSTALSPHREDYDTNIALFSDSGGGPLYTNDDIHFQSGSDDDYRSEITATLAAGTYALIVGTYGTQFGDDAINNSAAAEIPPGAVLRISKV